MYTARLSSSRARVHCRHHSCCGQVTGLTASPPDSTWGCSAHSQRHTTFRELRRPALDGRKSRAFTCGYKQDPHEMKKESP